mgnify:FL=1
MLFRSNSAAALVDDRERDLAHDYATRTKNLLSEAKKYRRMGLHDQAQQTLQLAERHGAREQAQDLRTEWNQADRDAASLRKAAQAAETRGELELCHQILRKLISRYPAHDMTVDLQFPVMIDSEPGVMVVIAGKPMQVPALIRVHPFNATRLELVRDGITVEFVITAEGPAHRFLPAP